VVDFGTGQASWSFSDDRKGSRILAFAPGVARSTIPIDWSHIVSVKVSISTKGPAASLGVGPVEISGQSRLPFSLPILPSHRPRTATFEVGGKAAATAGDLHPVTIEPGAGAVPLEVRYPELRGGVRLVVPPSSPLLEIPGAPVPVERTGVTHYNFDLATPHPGILTFNQGYDPRWTVGFGGQRDSPLPLFSLMNGFLMDPGMNGFVPQPGRARGTISYSGQRPASAGLIFSALAWIALASLATALTLSRREKRRGQVFERASPKRWSRLARVGIGVVSAALIVFFGFPLVRAWAHLSAQGVNYYWPQAVSGGTGPFWRTPDVKDVRLQQVDGPDQASATGVHITGHRRFFTVVEHDFASPQDWSSRRRVFLYVRGEGTGIAYRFILYTDDQFHDSLSFTFTDVQTGWRVLTFDLLRPVVASESPDLSHVVALRIATDDRTVTGSLALGTMTVSQPRSQ
jgi:hypothetical protein